MPYEKAQTEVQLKSEGLGLNFILNHDRKFEISSTKD